MRANLMDFPQDVGPPKEKALGHFRPAYACFAFALTLFGFGGIAAVRCSEIPRGHVIEAFLGITSIASLAGAIVCVIVGIAFIYDEMKRRRA